MTKNVLINLRKSILCPYCDKLIDYVKAETDEVQLGQEKLTFITKYRCIRPECNGRLNLDIRLKEMNP
jgi:hypothetical protein